MVNRSRPREGRTTRSRAVTTWIQPTSANPTPSTAELSMCEGTIAKCTAPAEAASDASSQRAGALSAKPGRAVDRCAGSGAVLASGAEEASGAR